MRTLEYIESEEKRKRIATETLEIYAPIAHRLGMGKFRCEMEDLSFKYLFQNEYNNVKKMLGDKHGKNIKSLKEIHDTLKRDWKKRKSILKILDIEKNIYTVYTKNYRKKKWI